MEDAISGNIGPKADMEEENAIEAWVAVRERGDRGHVEIRVNGLFYGFYPDHFQEVPAAGSKHRESRDAMHGGYVGKLRRRNEKLFTHYYYLEYAEELARIKIGENLEEIPIDLPLPRFEVARIEASERQRDNLMQYLDHIASYPPEYHYRSAEGATNCVSLSAKALRDTGIFRDAFENIDDDPTPAGFLEELDRLTRDDPRIARMSKDLKRPRIGFLHEQDSSGSPDHPGGVE